MPRPRSKPHRALCAAERQTVLDLLHEPRFADQAPAEIYACLLDEGIYHRLIRTMYRILAESQEVLERRSSCGIRLTKSRAVGAGAQRSLVLGHHQATGTGQMVLLLSLRHHRHFQPARRRLVCRRQGKRHHGSPRCSRTPPPNILRRRASSLCTPIVVVHAGQGHGTAARRSRRHQIPQPAAHLQ